MDIIKIQTSLEDSQRDVERSVSKHRARQIKHHNKIPNMKSFQFNKGSFVLIRKSQEKGHKESCGWMDARSGKW